MAIAQMPDEPVRSRIHETLRLNDLTGTEWVRGTKSIMFQRGLGVDHPETRYERLHPCPFSYKDAEQLVMFFTKRGERVLDPFSGVASTLKACLKTGRLGTGIELNAQYCAWAKERLETEVPVLERERYPQHIIEGDARRVVSELPDNAFHFVLTSPPYWDILSKRPDQKAKHSTALQGESLAYSCDPRDFGCIADYREFINEMASFVLSLGRLVRANRYLALIVADFRDGSTLYPYHADLITALRDQQSGEERGLVLQGVSILAQNGKRLYPYGYPTTYVPNIHHHYILIYRNMETKPQRSRNRKHS